MTGYFSAARGIAASINNGGPMRLIVGCTLPKPEQDVIGESYDSRAPLKRIFSPPA